MATREELLDHLWRQVINANLDPSSLHNAVARSQLKPMEPFSDTGFAINRLLAAGVQPKDICLIRRDAAYRAVFQTLYALDDPGVEDDDVFMLHESLLTSDPSGLEGRPGSADAA
jgi:hypothetical protein